MEKVNKPHNFSAILRNCDAAGVLEAHAVLPENKLDLHHATSGGTRKWIRVHTHPDVATAVRGLRERGFRILAAHPSPQARDFREVDFTRPTALMMGAELHGVSPGGLELADEHLVLPMLGMARSLNVSVATAVLLYEAMRQRQAAGLYDTPRIFGDEYRRTLFEWAHPLVADACRRKGIPYPPMDEDGQILAG